MKLKAYIEKMRAEGDSKPQQTLADKAGISKQYFSAIVNERVSPSFNALVSIYRATDGEVTFADFVEQADAD